MADGGGWDDKEIGRPAVLRLGDAYWMWYAGADSRFERAIGLAHSLDGIAWARFGPGPVLPPPARRRQPGYHSFANPCVLRRDDRFWLVANAQGERDRGDLVAATSVDGATWTTPALLATGPEPGGFGAPWAVEAGGLVHLFVPRREVDARGAMRGGRLLHAVSADLERWAWRDSTADGWGAADLDHPCLLPTAAGFTLWCGVYRDGRWAIATADSRDGDEWSPLVPAIESGPPGALDSAGALAPCVLREDGGLVMWHLGSSLSSDGYRGYLLRAASADGRSWRREPDEPVFRPSFGRYLNPF